MRRFSKRGQIWVETVIYTLIGLAIIGIVLSVAKPTLDAKKDEIAIEQAIDALGDITSRISDVQIATGNRRIIDVHIGKGTLTVDADKNSVSWLLDSLVEFSESGLFVSVGDLNVSTTGVDPWKVNLEKKYSVDIQLVGSETGKKSFTESTTLYRISVENGGIDSNGNTIIIIGEA